MAVVTLVKKVTSFKRLLCLRWYYGWHGYWIYQRFYVYHLNLFTKVTTVLMLNFATMFTCVTKVYWLLWLRERAIRVTTADMSYIIYLSSQTFGGTRSEEVKKQSTKVWLDPGAVRVEFVRKSGSGKEFFPTIFMFFCQILL